MHSYTFDQGCNYFDMEAKQFFPNYYMPTPFNVPLTMGMLTAGDEYITWTNLEADYWRSAKDDETCFELSGAACALRTWRACWRSSIY